MSTEKTIVGLQAEYAILSDEVLRLSRKPDANKSVLDHLQRREMEIVQELRRLNAPIRPTCAGAEGR